MPTERLSMRHIREVLRLHYGACRTRRCPVSKYVNRVRRAGLTWPLPTELDDDVQLESRLYPPPFDPARSIRSRIGGSCIASCSAGTSR